MAGGEQKAYVSRRAGISIRDLQLPCNSPLKDTSRVGRRIFWKKCAHV